VSGAAPLPAATWALTGTFALLAVATAGAALLARVNPRGDYTELRLRIRTWWPLAIGFFAAVSIDRAVSFVVLAIVSYVAFREYLSLVPTRRTDGKVMKWAYLAIPLQYFWAWTGNYGLFIAFIPVFVLLWLPARMALAGETAGFARASAITQWGLLTTVFALSHLAFLLALPQPAEARYDGATLLFFVVFLTEINDVAQYVWGKCVGRRQAAPNVSPNKTCEGLLGGVATTTLLAWLTAPWLTPLSGHEAAAAGLMIGVGGFVGDIVMSAIKRDAGVKDSGTALPGHGGILDRLDSLIFTAPLFFHYVHYLHY
jgi:phosphatidate cytidylyltransferase